jgi:hypothetical protein
LPLTAPASQPGRNRFFPFVALSLAVVLTTLVQAQTVSPRVVEFDPSPDHSRSAGGVALVTRYALDFYAVGSATRLQSIDLGKPAAQSNGKIRVDFTAQLGTWPLDGVVYEARVSAIGPGGATQSAVSNQFVFPATAPSPPPPTSCSFSVSPTSRSVGSSQTSGTLGVTASSGCSWKAVSSAPSWLIITGSPSGTGNGPVNYSVAANASSTTRMATLTVGSATLTLTQSGACVYTVSPTSRSFTPAGGTASVSVSAGAGCTWTATRAASATWITITAGASGTGNGTVSYRVSSHRGSANRNGTLTVAGRPVTITQASPTAPNAPAGLRIVNVR